MFDYTVVGISATRDQIINESDIFVMGLVNAKQCLSARIKIATNINEIICFMYNVGFVHTLSNFELVKQKLNGQIALSLN